MREAVIRRKARCPLNHVTYTEPAFGTCDCWNILLKLSRCISAIGHRASTTSREARMGHGSTQLRRPSIPKTYISRLSLTWTIDVDQAAGSRSCRARARALSFSLKSQEHSRIDHRHLTSTATTAPSRDAIITHSAHMIIEEKWVVVDLNKALDRLLFVVVVYCLQHVCACCESCCE